MSGERRDPSLDVVRDRIGRSLRGFASSWPAGVSEWDLAIHVPDGSLFPVPELVLLALRDVMGFRWAGVGEKVRWTVYCSVDGEPVALSLRKFGFRILARNEAPAGLVERIGGQLSSALKHLDPSLKHFAEDQIRRGRLTMVNRMHEFDARYLYFRGLAESAFAPDEEDKTASGGDPEDRRQFMNTMNARINRQLQREREGFFASGAMVDAWFSRLEHRMLLLRAFVGRPLADGEFRGFLARRWDERLAELLDGRPLGDGPDLLGRLREVRATIRNPLAHGGVENDGGAFYFHMPRIGAVPANLSRYRGGLRTNFVPIADTTHEATCALFDAVDACLTSGSFALPAEFVRWGIDPQYDAETVTSYGEAIAEGSEGVDRLIEHLSRAWERHANMDY